MIYDFGGFDPSLRTLVYSAPGAPDVAREAHGFIEDAGFSPVLADTRGYDHGVWVPLMLLYPEGDLPVAQLSAGIGSTAILSGQLK